MRVVVKVGTSTLTAGTKQLSRRAMLAVVEQLAGMVDAGHSVALVSSGAIAAGREALGYPELPSHVAGKQMLAAVGQTRLMQTWAELFSIFGLVVGQVLLTRGELSGRTGYLNARDALQTLLSHGVVPIINENDTVATEEIRVGDNDNLSALVANLVDADILILATDQEGLFTADPRTDLTARRIPTVAKIDESVFALAGGSGTSLGTGGMVTKLQAAQRAGQSGISTVILSLRSPHALDEAVAGAEIGTRFLPTAERRESRERWLLSEPPLGTITVDSGAESRLKTAGASLLPVGVVAVEGSYERGDVVQVKGPDGSPFAVGICLYAADDARKLIGAPTAQIEAILGFTLGDALIHRDNLVLLSPRSSGLA